MKPEKIYAAIAEIEKDYFPGPTKTTEYDQTYLDSIAENEGSIKIVFDRAHFKVISISANLEAISGYTYEEWTENNMLLAFTEFMSGDDNFLFSWVKSADLILEKAGSLLNYKAVFCGVSVKHKLGNTIRTLWRYLPVEVGENHLVITAIISVDDVTHLMKSDAHWGRTVYGNLKKPKYHHIHSKENVDVFSDIISEREKEVLRLIAQGMESKEIGKTLFISVNTVDNHRRNMIAKTGVRDTTALVQICRMCGII